MNEQLPRLKNERLMRGENNLLYLLYDDLLEYCPTSSIYLLLSEMMNVYKL
jgi:hypothetical protein